MCIFFNINIQESSSSSRYFQTIGCLCIFWLDAFSAASHCPWKLAKSDCWTTRNLSMTWLPAALRCQKGELVVELLVNCQLLERIAISRQYKDLEAAADIVQGRIMNVNVYCCVCINHRMTLSYLGPEIFVVFQKHLVENITHNQLPIIWQNYVHRPRIYRRRKFWVGVSQVYTVCRHIPGLYQVYTRYIPDIYYYPLVYSINIPGIWHFYWHIPGIY